MKTQGSHRNKTNTIIKHKLQEDHSYMLTVKSNKKYGVPIRNKFARMK